MWLEREGKKKVECLALMISLPDRNGEDQEVVLIVGTALLIEVEDNTKGVIYRMRGGNKR